MKRTRIGIIPITAFVFIGMLVVSCNKSLLNKKLDQLDYTIANKHIYIENFKRKVTLFQDSLQFATSDSLRWRYANQLYKSFYSYSLDSAMLYVKKMKKIAKQSGIRELILHSEIANVKVLYQHRNDQYAIELFEAIDTTGLDSDISLRREYRECGMALYRHFGNQVKDKALEKRYKKTCQALTKDFREMDSTTSLWIRIRSNELRAAHKPEEALRLMQSYWENKNLTEHDKSLIAYHIASIYRDMQDREGMKTWYAESAIHDLQVPVRNELSLYHLAMALYQDKEYTRASHYIKLTMKDHFQNNFETRTRETVEALDIINGAKEQMEKERFIILTSACIIFTVLLLTVFRLLKKNHQYTQQLKEHQQQLMETNKVLNRYNQQLTEANHIKENYLFKYMELAAFYINKAESVRHDLRKVAKSGGYDAIMALLRTPGNSKTEYKKFYQIFDETFLHIFPDFIKTSFHT